MQSSRWQTERELMSIRRTLPNSNPQRSASAKLRIQATARKKVLGKEVVDKLTAASQEAIQEQAELHELSPNRYRRKRY